MLVGLPTAAARTLPVFLALTQRQGQQKQQEGCTWTALLRRYTDPSQLHLHSILVDLVEVVIRTVAVVVAAVAASLPNSAAGT